SKLKNREVVVGVIPCSAIGDAYLSDGTNTTFNVINCRVKRRVKFYFVRSDFGTLVDGTDVNAGGTTRWFLSLKMTPIVDY
ncbi:MAG: hypothetical protein ACK559_38890, partial [bacterium]